MKSWIRIPRWRQNPSPKFQDVGLLPLMMQPSMSPISSAADRDNEATNERRSERVLRGEKPVKRPIRPRPVTGCHQNGGGWMTRWADRNCRLRCWLKPPGRDNHRAPRVNRLASILFERLFKPIRIISAFNWIVNQWVSIEINGSENEKAVFDLRYAIGMKRP